MKSATKRSSTAFPKAAGARPKTSPGAACFLSSKDADYLNGTVMNVDGGWLSR
jgi:NAD(P)-dependent dehydrogenase (short-subunit alcohol dehydrogenase family)